MGVDKRKAQKHSWRISEKDLFTLAALGGAIGIKLGMNVFHHKTLHKKFKLGIPFIILINIVLYVYAIFLTNGLNGSLPFL
jgi:uncharacterized membrane protein YsdA (DUF1294 family)